MTGERSVSGRRRAGLALMVAGWLVSVWCLVAPTTASATPALPATTTTVFTVTTNTDSTTGSCSAGSCTTLRAALAAADRAGGTVGITFAAGADGTIPLDSELEVAGSETLTIMGNGDAATVLSGQGKTRVLEVGRDATVTLANLTIEDGHAINGESDAGGVNNLGDLTILNSTVSGNRAGDGGDGGGHDYPNGPAGFLGGLGGFGGGVYSSGPLTILNSTISGNRAGDGGHGGDGYFGFGGGAGGLGGGVYSTGPLTMVNSTVTGNRAGDGGDGGRGTYPESDGFGGIGGRGGGVRITNPVNTITSSTIAGNSAGHGGSGGNGGSDGPDGTGGGVGGTAVTLTDTILAANTFGNCFLPAPIGDPPRITDGGHNLAYPAGTLDSSCELTAAKHDVIGADPLLGPLAPNGGPTETMALGPGSPAIGAGGSCSTVLDQRGVPRIHPCDIGAYETLAAQATLTVTSTTGTVGTPLPLTTSGGSGTGAVTYTVVDGSATGCAISAASPYTLTTSAAGTCTVTAHKAASPGYLAATSAPTAVALLKLAQAALTVTSTGGTFGVPLALTATGGSGTGAVTYTVVDGTAAGCTVSAGAPPTLIAATPGTCRVTAHKAGDVSYLPASSAPTIVTLLTTQVALRITSTAGALGTPLVLTTSGGSGNGPVTYTVVDGSATGCTISAAAPYTLTASTAGTCTVTALKAGDATHTAASSPATAVTLIRTGTIAKLYRAVLGREGNPAGLSYWTARLDGGATPAHLAALMATTPEGIRHDIAIDYNQALGRNPDTLGTAYWASLLASSHAPHTILALLQASPEAFASAGSTSTGYVLVLYQQLLGRTPTPEDAGVAYWTVLLHDGTPRAQVALAIARTPEAARHAATTTASLVCGTTPTGSTVAALEAAYQQPGTTPSLLRGLAALQPGCTVHHPISPPPLRSS